VFPFLRPICNEPARLPQLLRLASLDLAPRDALAVTNDSAYRLQRTYAESAAWVFCLILSRSQCSSLTRSADIWNWRFHCDDLSRRTVGERPLLAQSGPSRNEGLWNNRLVADSVEKVFFGWRTNFFGPLMRFAHGDVRDHIVSEKSDHGPSYRRY